MKRNFKIASSITALSLVFVSLSFANSEQSLAVDDLGLGGGATSSQQITDQGVTINFPPIQSPEAGGSETSTSGDRNGNRSADTILAQLTSDLNLSSGAKQLLVKELSEIGFKTSSALAFENALKNKKNYRQSPTNPRAIGESPRILLGSNAAPGQAPWQAGLVDLTLTGPNKNSLWMTQFCGGSIISARWILTAAHCVDWANPKQIAVVTGLTRLPDGPSRANTSAVKQIIIHPLWFSDSHADIALLELRVPLRFSVGRQPIEIGGQFPIGTPATISGWGVSGSTTEVDEFGDTYEASFSVPELQIAETPLIACPEGYESFNGSFTGIICSGSAEPDTQPDSCFGDSGGPMAAYDGVSQTWRLIGATSFGLGCPPSGIGAYADVDYFQDWIMCHAEVIAPIGGPYFCGDEAGLDVASTVKVSSAAWGAPKPQITWRANGVAIKGANNRTSLGLAAHFNKEITVSITSLGETVDHNFGTVGEAFFVQGYSAKQFVPCTSLKLGQPNQGKCGSSNEFLASLQSSPGIDPKSGRPFSFWAMKDFTVPKKTTSWSWGLFEGHSRGICIGENAPFECDVQLGEVFSGAFGSATTPTQSPLDYWVWSLDSEPYYDLWGPMVTDDFSQTLVNGKARIVMKTDGQEDLGSYFDFAFGLIVGSHQ